MNSSLMTNEPKASRLNASMEDIVNDGAFGVGVQPLKRRLMSTDIFISFMNRFPLPEMMIIFKKRDGQAQKKRFVFGRNTDLELLQQVPNIERFIRNL
jgi:hypothetical protein